MRNQHQLLATAAPGQVVAVLAATSGILLTNGVVKVKADARVVVQHGVLDRTVQAVAPPLPLIG